jgi:release factor glutamine methyltransferase
MNYTAYLCTMNFATNRLREMKRNLLLRLEEIYPPREAESIVNLLIRDFLGLTRAGQQLQTDLRLTESEILRFQNALDRLMQGEPLQYLTGNTEFYGLTLSVGPGVLIPRPETEEMVDRILKENRDEEKRVLDIGTGSGCIALALKSRRKQWRVTGIDLSSEALKIAKKNGEVTALEVDFRQCDVLDTRGCLDKTGKSFHLIVSNPPYVLQSESRQMAVNVLNYEPHVALFVEDDNPLLFYEKIAEFSQTALYPGGKLYFEVNENLADATARLLENQRFSEVEIFTDIHGKHRFVRCRKL